MNFLYMLSSYETVYYCFCFFAIFGFFSFLFWIVKIFWTILNGGKKVAATVVDKTQNKKIEKLESEVKSLRNLESELDALKKQVNK